MTDDIPSEDEREKLKRRLLRPYDESERREIMRDRLSDLFGDVVFSYTDRDAIDDGILIPFVVNGRDTRHRITRNSYDALREHYRPTYPEYGESDYYRFFFNELLPLVPEAFRVYRKRGILTTGNSSGGEPLREQ